MQHIGRGRDDGRKTLDMALDETVSADDVRRHWSSLSLLHNEVAPIGRTSMQTNVQPTDEASGAGEHVEESDEVVEMGESDDGQ